MIDKKSINFDSIRDLYYRWRFERDEKEKRFLENEIKKIGTRDFLIYSFWGGNSTWPYNTFREIFSLDDLFATLSEMKSKGEDISELTHNILFIETQEDIESINRLVKSDVLLEIQDFSFIFSGTNIFKYGDLKSIGKKLPISRVSGLSIETVESMIQKGGDFKGIPVTITIDNIGQLPIEKLEEIEKYFDVGAISIIGKAREGRATQGETLPLTLRGYKDIRKSVDEIINNLYVNENGDKFQRDYQITTQVIDAISQRVGYDYAAAEKQKGASEVRAASGMVGLLTGKSICLGYSEILRNVLSCVGIESHIIDGTNMEGIDHAWNQIRIGDKWFNVDLTNAAKAIREGRTPGDLYMSDKAFYGERRRTTFKNGPYESTVYIGGHSPRVFSSYVKKCEGFIPPYVTAKLLEDSRHYDENYKTNGQNPDYKGPVPFVGEQSENNRTNKANSNPNPTTNYSPKPSHTTSSHLKHDRKGKNRGVSKIPIDIE